MKQKLVLGLTLVACAALSMSCKPRKGAAGAADVDEESGVVNLGGMTCTVASPIEDGENNDNQVLVQDGRNGYIYTFTDSEGSTVEPLAGGTYTMSDGGADGSAYAARMKGTMAPDASIVYVGLGFNLTDPKAQYDVSKYDGLTFKIRKGPESMARVRLKVPDVNTDPDGGQCQECFNDFGVDITAKETWVQYFVPWSAMKQMAGWGNPQPPALDTKTVYGIQFQVQAQGQAFDIWVDDLAFVSCQ